MNSATAIDLNKVSVVRSGNETYESLFFLQVFFRIDEPYLIFEHCFFDWNPTIFFEVYLSKLLHLFGCTWL